MSEHITLSPELTDEVRAGVMGDLHTLSDRLHSATSPYMVRVYDGDWPQATEEDAREIREALAQIGDLAALAAELDLPLGTAQGMEFILDRTPSMTRAVGLALTDVAQMQRSALGDLAEGSSTEDHRRMIDRIDRIERFVDELGAEAVIA